MTVQELIDELMKIEDKNKLVKVWGKWSNCYETDFDVEDGDCVVLDD
jgi:chromosome condensin MukBEF MukE localization factor